MVFVGARVRNAIRLLPWGCFRWPAVSPPCVLPWFYIGGGVMCVLCLWTHGRCCATQLSFARPTHGRWYANAMLGWGWEGGMITFVVCECSFVGEAGWFCASHARMSSLSMVPETENLHLSGLT